MRYPLAIGLTVATAACGRFGFDRLESDLVITPAVARMNLNSQISFVATGGEAPYLFASPTGTGELDSSTGVFRAPGYPVTVTVEVIDAAGATGSAQVIVGGDMLYVVGGFTSGVARDDVWRSIDGVTWDVVGHLPLARGGGALVVFDDRLIYAGGADAPEGTSFSEVWSSSDGVAWTQIGDLPFALNVSTEAVVGDRIWLFGGRIPGENFITNVWSSADGTSWQDEPPLAVGQHGGRAAIVGGELWLVAGHDAAGQTAAIWSQRGDGSWLDRGQVPVAGEYHGVTVLAGSVWVAGGLGLQDRVVATTDGTTWTDLPRLPIPREHPTLLEWQDAMWVIAGLPAHTWRSADGGAWSIVGMFPALVDSSHAVPFTPR